jgi:exopolyphosphatase/guanosine-5'-triphosphate,3'-diphosphate pyrophosphatase
MSKAIIAIDLGSNSIRVLKMNCETKESLSEFHKTVKTADNLASTGIISEDALNRVVVAINEAKDKMDFSDAKVKAVTTEAIRQATNGDEVLSKIKEQTGVEFEVIDGVAEAKYALIAVENRLKLLNQNPKSFMLVDIGGGSTELLFSYGKDKVFSKSFQVGIVTVTQKFNGLAEIAQAMPILMNPMRNYYNQVVSEHGEVEIFIATAGTPTTIASMKHGMYYNTYDADKIHGTILSQKDLVQQLERLITMSHKERVKSVGVGRDDLIASGVLIYDELYNISGFKESMVIDDGIREGVAYAVCENS